MLAAVTVTVAMRTVGLLLVCALMVVPVATSQQLTRGFRTTLVAAMVLGHSPRRRDGHGHVSRTSTWLPEPRSCCSSLAGFVATWPLGIWLRRRPGCAAPFLAVDPPARDRTSTATTTGTSTARTAATVAVEHGDHVDYIHDGHRHAAHGGHYDEH